MSAIPPIGVANSVSANFKFDPVDALEFALQSRFELLQVYLNQDLLNDGTRLERIAKHVGDFHKVYFHSEGYLNQAFYDSDYRKKLFAFLDTVEAPNFIIHFDERENIDVLIRLVEQLGSDGPTIYLENYFQMEGEEAAEKNLKKYQALFTLSNNFGNPLFPVLDIPRLFHENLGFAPEKSLEWCYQTLNFFGNRRIPIVLHLIDASATDQARASFTRLGEGYMPFDDIFAFIRKTRPTLEGIILEYEDKMNPLSSRDYIRERFA